MEAVVNFLLIFLLTVTMTSPASVQLVVNGDDVLCQATAIGAVEAKLIAYYDLDGSIYAYEGPSRWLQDQTITTIADWTPVAVQYYGKPIGGSRFHLRGGCGAIPPRDIMKEPRSMTMLTECEIQIDEPMEMYIRAYYLHEDPATPGERYFFRSENFIADIGPVDFILGFPIAIQWYYRECGSLVHSSLCPWKLAKTCGELPM
jgi:hypothetical protein